MIGTVMQAAVHPLMGEVSTLVADTLATKMRRPGRPWIGASKLEDLWFSASDLSNLCPRMCALAAQTPGLVRPEVDPESMFNFAVGSGYHSAFQDEMLVLGLGDVFQGCWEREVNGVLERVDGTQHGPHTERGWGPRPPGDYWKFRESKGRIPEVRLVGKWDGVLAWPDAPHEVFELKSIRDELFPNVNPVQGGRPMAAHCVQVQSYMWMSGLDRARILYVSKGARSIREGIAEHVVMRDEAVIADIRSLLLSCVEAVQGAWENRPLPEKLATGCRIRSDVRAKKCGLRDACFIAAKSAT